MICSALPIHMTEPPVTNGLLGQVFIYGQANQSAFINVPWEVKSSLLYTINCVSCLTYTHIYIGLLLSL